MSMIKHNVIYDLSILSKYMYIELPLKRSSLFRRTAGAWTAVAVARSVAAIRLAQKVISVTSEQVNARASRGSQGCIAISARPGSMGSLDMDVEVRS